MKKLLLPLLALLSVTAGGGGGYFLKIASSSKHTSSSEESAQKTLKKHSTKTINDTEDVSVFKFSRQFVIPVLIDRRPQYMIILEINLEMATSSTSDAYAKESQVRDAVLETLFELAAEGVLGGLPSESEARAVARLALLEGARSVLGEEVRDVLIQDVGVQRY